MNPCKAHQKDPCLNRTLKKFIRVERRYVWTMRIVKSSVCLGVPRHEFLTSKDCGFGLSHFLCSKRSFSFSSAGEKSWANQGWACRWLHLSVDRIGHVWWTWWTQHQSCMTTWTTTFVLKIPHMNLSTVNNTDQLTERECLACALLKTSQVRGILLHFKA